MEDIFTFADKLGPLKIIHVHEPSIGLKAVLVVDNVAKGPSIGGMRIAPDVSTEECVRLARAMTFKNAAAGLPHGGGKIVIYGDPKMPRAEKKILLRGLAQALRNEDSYIFAPDMGTNEECMAWIRDEVGRVVGLPSEIGGIPLDEITPATMQSRVCSGLYLCGEICDVDGRIGGFNFQWAWSSGVVAGRAAALSLQTTAD